MSSSRAAATRPPIGFIVEGRDEYVCYPSVVARILGTSGLHIPCSNAGGYGNITRSLGELLNELVLAYHPCHVIVTMDARDPVKDGLFPDCRKLRDAVTRIAASWLEKAVDNDRLSPLPARITVVIQVQQWESWMIADTENLVASGYLRATAPHHADVDQEIGNPSGWLAKNQVPGKNLRKPNCARSAIACLDISTMRTNSRSFDKFCREVLGSFSQWARREFGGHL